MKKGFMAVLAVLVICSGLIFARGQQDTESVDGKVKIIFGVNETPILTSDFWEIVSNRYMEKNPNVVIENVAQPSSNIMHKDFLKTLLATDQFPDIMVMASPGDFVSADALMALPASEMDYLRDTSNGKIMGENYVAVYKQQVGGFWFNRTAFNELGLDEPETYAQLVEACKVIKADGRIPITMGLKDGWPQLVLASMLISADVLSEDPDWGFKRNRDEIKFSDPGVKGALDKYQELIQEYANEDLASVTYTQMIEYFFSGRALMLPMGSWVQGEEAKINPDFEVGFFPVPGENAASTVSVWNNEGLAINADTEHPEVCLDFLEFFFSDDVWYSQFLKTEMLFPSRKDPVEYEMSNLRREVGDKVDNLTLVEHWYDMTGDAALLPGLQSYFNKMTQRIAMGSDVAEELRLYDEEWAFSKSNMQ